MPRVSKVVNRSALTAVFCTLVATMLGIPPAGGETWAEPVIEKQTENVTLVDHIHCEVGSDMQFQRRRGRTCALAR